MNENRRHVSRRLELAQAGGGKASRAGRESGAKPAVVRGKRILLVEDTEPLRACLRLMLELDGHQVTEAGDGAEALKSFTKGDIDLVITDLEMPVMEGNELASSLKLLAPSLPILMITASDKARGGVENPVDALLNKPVRISELRRALGQLLPALPDPAQPGAAPSLEPASVALAAEGQIGSPSAGVTVSHFKA